jgi:hypothetical protein
MRCFGISEFRSFRSVEKRGRRSHEIMRQILTVGCEETHGNKLENLRVRDPDKWSVK